MNLHLINRTEIGDADRKLIRFMEAEYELYDGISTPHDCTISLYDILLSIMMNSRLDTAEKVQSIWKGRAKVEKALGGIPADIALEDENVPWDELEVLFTEFCGIPWAKAAVSTKILYRKRPNLIPIIDSIISRYLNEHNDAPRPREMSLGQGMVRDMKYFRKLLQGSLNEINALRELPEMQKSPVSAVRVLEVLIWIDNEDNGYYISCPECNAEKVIPIRYGEPSDKMIEEAMSGKISLGGCCISDDSPRWCCPQCETEFGRLVFPKVRDNEH